MKFPIFGKVAKNLVSMLSPVLSAVGGIFGLMRRSVGCDIRANLLSVCQISLTVVVPFIIGLLFLGAFTVRHLPPLAPSRFASNLFTLSTFPLSTPASWDTDIFGCEFMTTDTVTLGRRATAGNVFRKGARVKMFRIHALGNPAQVIEGQAVRYRPFHQFVREPMRHMSAAFKSQMPIPGLVNGSNPKPTGRSLQNPGIKSFINGTRAHGLGQVCGNLAANAIRREDMEYQG